LFGSLADRLPSRRLAFLLGCLVLFLSTLAFAFATTIPLLLIARLLEGLSGAFATVFGFTLLTDRVGRDGLGKAMGWTSLAMTFGMMIGPVIGGVLYEYCGYFSVFLPGFALVVVEGVLRASVVEDNGKSEKGVTAASVTESSACSSSSAFHGTLSMSDLEHASGSDVDFSKNPETAYQSPTAQSVQNQDITETAPLLPPLQNSPTKAPNAYRTILSAPRFTFDLLALFTTTSLACSFDSTLTPFVSSTFSMHAIHAASLFLALAMPMLLSPVSGALTDKWGPRIPSTAGLALVISGFLALAAVRECTEQRLAFWELAAALAALGIGLTLTTVPLRTEAALIIQQLEKNGRFGVGGVVGKSQGLVSTAIAGGGFVGPLYAGFLRIRLGWGWLQALNAAFCGGLLLGVWIVPRIDIHGEVKQSEGAEGNWKRNGEARENNPI
ncbi:MAG: hypothetical protein Q9164_003828, partial [Protoblastenia rupestris]